MHLTINEKFSIQDLIHNLRPYIKGCHIGSYTEKYNPSLDSYNIKHTLVIKL